MTVSKLKIEPQMKQALDAGFAQVFGGQPQRYFSAPGRTEIGGNHTDHQRGKVLAGAVNLDTVAAVCPNGTNIIRIQSKGYHMSVVDLSDMTPAESEINSTPALIRGVAARFAQLGCKVEGFDAYCESTVLPGSGLSFGKPCGLMDQTASAVGNLVTIDFFDKDNPVIEPVNFDFASCGHALCIIDSGADHADLTDEYAAIPGEIKAVAACFGKEVLTQIDEADFYGHISYLREKCGDRAVMRCIHFYQETALREGDFDRFLSLIRQSGYSSWMYLQNVIPAGYKAHQDVAVALGLAEHYLAGRGAYRVHGGGFAGTIQAFVPYDILDSFVEGMDSVLGKGACHVLSIRPQGGVEMEVE